MKRLIFSTSRVFGRLRRQQRGATAVLFAVVVTGLFGTVGLTVDVARVFAAKTAFTAATQAASLAGAQALLQTGATQDTVSAAVATWNSANPPSNVTVTGTTTTLSCVTATANLPSCSGSNPNAVNVAQTGTVSTHFLKAFGFPSFTLASTSAAAKAGGAGTPLNLMFVLDSTGSMNTADGGCTVTGVRNPTRYQCALFSVQSVLKVMQPSMGSVGLMAFPGTGSQFTPSKPCPTQPSAVPYLSSNVHYQIGSGLSTDYNNGSGTLSHTSTIVEAVGDYGSSPALTGCQTAKGGEGTYLAEVLTKAQAALPVVAGTKNVIILLSDGDANASSSQLNNQSSKTSRQCNQYVTAAQTATTAGTTVYAVAYGAPTSGCSSGDTYNPCTALQAAASNSTTFYSTNNTCAASLASHNVTNLPAIFTQIATSLTLTKPRLL